jgi:large-conductance mechanosensitive channel
MKPKNMKTYQLINVLAAFMALSWAVELVDVSMQWGEVLFGVVRLIFDALVISIVFIINKKVNKRSYKHEKETINMADAVMQINIRSHSGAKRNFKSNEPTGIGWYAEEKLETTKSNLQKD